MSNIPGLGLVPAFLGGGFSPLSGASSWNPSDRTSTALVLSNGNLTATHTDGLDPELGVRALQGRSAGKFYWEVKVDAVGTILGIGARAASANLTAAYPGTNGGANYRFNGSILYGASSAVSTGAGGLDAGVIIGIALDLSLGLIYFSRNGSWVLSHNPEAGTGGISWGTGTLHPYVCLSINGQAVTANFGATPFVYPVPSGFTGGFA